MTDSTSDHAARGLCDSCRFALRRKLAKASDPAIPVNMHCEHLNVLVTAELDAQLQPMRWHYMTPVTEEEALVLVASAAELKRRHLDALARLANGDGKH